MFTFELNTAKKTKHAKCEKLRDLFFLDIARAAIVTVVHAQVAMLILK